MDWYEVENNWSRLRSRICEQWAKLNDEDLDAINGVHERLVSKLRERYGLAVEEAELQIKSFLKELEEETGVDLTV